MSVPVNTSRKLSRTILWVILFFYMAIVTRFIIFKKRPGSIRQYFENLPGHFNIRYNIHHGRVNLTPFSTMKLYMSPNMPAKYAVINLLGNLAGFIPLGILLPLLFVKLRSATATIFTVLLISLSFEILQLFGMLGVCDIDDLILNTLGGAIGYGIYLLLKKLLLFNREYPYLYQKSQPVN